MHVERHDGAPNLPELFERFVVHSLKGRILDDRKDEEAKLGKFPDFACFRNLVLIEMKHLEAEQNARVNATYKSKLRPDEEPIFFGQRQVDLGKFSNAQEIGSAILTKLSQTIETQLRKANRQFRDYRIRNPRKNSISICLLLNSQIDEFSPDVALHAIHRKMKSVEGVVRFPDIDAVMFVSEKHFQNLPDGRIALGIVILFGASCGQDTWKMGVVDLVAARWSEFRTGDAPVAGNSKNFEAIVDVPEKMKRHEAWKLAYLRNPYLRALTDYDLKMHFHRCVAMNSLSFIKGGWTKPTQEETSRGIRHFGDAIQEINHRNMDMREFDMKKLSPDELKGIYLDLPQELFDVMTGRIA